VITAWQDVISYIKDRTDMISGKKETRSINMGGSLFQMAPIAYSKPLHLFLITVVLIFLAETIIMSVFPLLTPQLELREALLDASLLTLIIFPILYIFLIRPLKRQVAELKKAEEAILQITLEWEDIFNTITDIVTIHDRDFNVVRANRSALKKFRLQDLDKMLNSKCYKYYHGTESPLKGCPSCNSLKTGEPCSSEIFEPHLNMFMEIRAIPRLDKNNEIIGLIHVVRDITERKQMEKKLHNLSLTDELTGLYNRRGFFNLFEHHLKIAKRQNKRLLLLYADLDNLKEINDTFGHQEGDFVLAEVANLLKTTYRESDIVARIGGDEFVVFPVGTNDDHVEAITLRLQNNVDVFNAQKERSYKLSISVGVSRYDSLSPHTADELLAEADRLMYSCKKNRKGG
jgi:two-component system cell cycle response regulator